uniref:ribonuclease H n=1 Tax=Astyanax mexicanus TaxID=7994 RepID=A0A8B9H0C2_ASTMX
MKLLAVKHHLSSSYHPESQGALERFHQTLKTMLRTYCQDSEKEWDEGIPFLLFAVRETVQESLGFSPSQLVFGHTVRGPLKLLREKLVSDNCESINLLDYVSSFRERLFQACEVAKASLATTQSQMKARFDKKSVKREFKCGDQVLVLLPIPGSALCAKFSGPYTVERKLSETDYIIHTPDRQRKTRVCHINMLKPYVQRGKQNAPSVKPVTVATMLEKSDHSVDDDLPFRDSLIFSPHLPNSAILSNLDAHLMHLSEEERHDVVKLINDYSCLFSDVPSQTNVLSHDIDVQGHLPIKQHAYRVNPMKRQQMQNEVQYLLENDLATPSVSSWSSPCLLVPKPDGTNRFCTDYRKVNSVTKPDSFPLPRMEDCIDRVGTAKFVTKLDLLKGYWQVPLTPAAAEISAFVTPDSFLQYSVMPFGLRNAPATFQRLMWKVLANVKNCEAYLDDLVSYSETWEEHLKILRTVFERLKEASLTLNLAKCEFGKARVSYLGKQVGQGEVRPLEAKTQAILDFKVPTTKRDLRRFLGMAGYYRGFCKNFATVVAPLTNLLKKDRTMIWTVECDYAFNSVKTLLCNTPVLVAPDFSKPFKLEVDASASGAGAVL